MAVLAQPAPSGDSMLERAEAGETDAFIQGAGATHQFTTPSSTADDVALLTAHCAAREVELEGSGRCRRRRIGIQSVVAAAAVLAVASVSVWHAGGGETINEGSLQSLFKATAVGKLLARARYRRVLSGARGEYSEAVASAMGALAKLSYCGLLPGIYAATTGTCSDSVHVGSSSLCRSSNVTIVPGFVRTVSAFDQNVGDSVFGLIAKVENTTEHSAFGQWSAVVAIRGSIDNAANGVRDAETALEPGPEGCDGCHIHRGHHASMLLILEQIKINLGGILCNPGNCTVHVTGHASGGAIASLLAWHLSENNYTIGNSYLFEPTRAGDATFAKRMAERFTGVGEHGTMYSVTAGQDGISRWPSSGGYKSWGVEVFYNGTESKHYHQVCWAGAKGCGVAAMPRGNIRTDDACGHPKAPNKNFCHFKGFAAECYGGLSHQYVMSVPELWRNVTAEMLQPAGSAASDWYPIESTGAQKEALAEQMDLMRQDGWLEGCAKKDCNQFAQDYYSAEALKAYAALAKLSYCGQSSGFDRAVLSTCGPEGVCGDAGFEAVPNTVFGGAVSYQSEKTLPFFMRDTLFFYTALLHRTDANFSEAPHFVPSSQCALVFRGTVNLQNKALNRMMNQTELDDPTCKGCSINAGLYSAWLKLEPIVLSSLETSGCVPNPPREKTSNVVLAGHSMGGTLASVAAYFLNKRGFKVQLSWLLEAGRPGNPAFVDHLASALSKDRLVPYWLVTHADDKIPRTGSSTFNAGDNSGLGRHPFMLHFPALNASESDNGETRAPVVCSGEAGVGAGSSCGTYQYARAAMNSTIPSDEHCKLWFAPKGNMCMFQTSTVPDYRLVDECFTGNSLTE